MELMPYELDDFAERVMRECSNYLDNRDEFTNLYRGMHGAATDTVHYDVPIRRKDLYGDPALMQALSKQMKQDGFSATRTNSIFATSDPEWAIQFGDVFVVYPVGSYAMTFFDAQQMPYGADLGNNRWATGTISAHRSEFPSELDDKQIIQQYPDQIAEMFWNDYGQLFENSTSVFDAYDLGSEVMIAGSNYHAVPIRYERDVAIRLADYY